MGHEEIHGEKQIKNMEVNDETYRNMMET